MSADAFNIRAGGIGQSLDDESMLLYGQRLDTSVKWVALPENMAGPYSYVVCDGCGQEWQRIDWGCAHHRLYCNPIPDQPGRRVPVLEHRLWSCPLKGCGCKGYLLVLKHNVPGGTLGVYECQSMHKYLWLRV